MLTNIRVPQRSRDVLFKLSMLLIIMNPRLDVLLNVLADQKLRILVPLSTYIISNPDEMFGRELASLT
jgi:hypothetical protein